jgi:hypothetical protein
MAGLVPAIHVFKRFNKARKQDVDARHKAGHDESILIQCAAFGIFGRNTASRPIAGRNAQT